MDPAPEPQEPRVGDVVKFDDALLEACSAEELGELMAEAELLAQAFAPERRAAQIAALAQELKAGARDLEMGRPHALRLAAALGRLAREAGE